MKYTRPNLNVFWLTGCIYLLICSPNAIAQTQPSVVAQLEPVSVTKPITVRVAPVILSSQDAQLYLEGVAYPLLSTTISAQAAGTIRRITVAEGTFVEEGELLLQLDDSQIQIELKRAKSKLTKTKVELLKSEAGAREQEVNIAKAQLGAQQAVLKKNTLELKRIKELFTRGMVTLQQKQNIIQDNKKAKAKLKELEARLNLLIEGARNEDIMINKAIVQINEAELELLEYKAAKSIINAPFHGVITKKYKEIGEMVKEGDPLTEIINIEKILIRCNVSEKNIKSIKLGQQAEITFKAYPDNIYTGTIKEIIPKIDPQSGGFPVKIEVDNREHLLYAGMTAQVNFSLGAPKQVLSVPKDALISQDGKTHLFIIDDLTARAVKVITGQENGGLIEVKGELKAGDKVAVSNTNLLQDKTKVAIETIKSN